MKKWYQNPLLEILSFEQTDIVRTSGGGNEVEGGNDGNPNNDDIFN